jgi:hypothetical protein
MRVAGCSLPLVIAAVATCAWLDVPLAAAADRYALIVAGAPGAEDLAVQQKGWARRLAGELTGRLGVDGSRVTVLVGGDGPAGTRATRENVRAAIERVRQRASPDDLFAIVLIGHGTFDGVSAKFNLVGPDLDASDWASLLEPVRARVVLVNTTAASAPFLGRLAGPRRVIVTATSNAAQRFDTVFAEPFTAAFAEADADLDKDGRVSIWEAFAFASARVKRYYDQRGQLATERAVLDDTGDGVGKEAGEVGPDGSVASRLFLDAGPEVGRAASPAVSELLARRQRLLDDLDELKRKRSFMPAEDYDRELERLLVEIARLSRAIRQS